MRERTQLDDAVKGIDAMDLGMAENLELLELAEDEDDADMVAEAEFALTALRDDGTKRQLESLLSGGSGFQRCVFGSACRCRRD